MQKSRVWAGLIVAGLLAPAVFAQDAHLPPADEILQKVRAAMPQFPFTSDMRIYAQSRAGKVEKQLAVKLEYRWARPAPAAHFAVRDAFGADLSRYEIRWLPGGQTQFRTGAPTGALHSASAGLYERWEGTDVTPADISLAFLWLADGQTVGMESILNRTCYVVDLTLPAADRASGDAVLRLWVDQQMFALLQVESYDAKSELTRRMRIRAFRKMDDLWMLEDVDLTSFPSRHKTLLRLSNFNRLDRPPPAAEASVPPVAPVN